MRIGRRDVRLTNLEKLYFPECGAAPMHVSRFSQNATRFRRSCG